MYLTIFSYRKKVICAQTFSLAHNFGTLPLLTAKLTMERSPSQRPNQDRNKNQDKPTCAIIDSKPCKAIES